MRNPFRNSFGALFAGITGVAAAMLSPAGLDQALAQGSQGKRNTSAVQQPAFTTDHQSSIRIGERDGFPVHRGIKLGRNKSVLVELSRELRDVVVSAPDIMDAVVQSSNRVYLIGKKTGQSNAFLFDQSGEQIVTLEVEIEHDTTALDQLMRRLIPGSNIKTEMMHETVILTGSVRSPVDSTRAFDIASRFVTTPAAEENSRHKQKVINLLSVDGEEQVMLQVVVAEVQRSVLKQFGINIGGSFTLGNFVTALSTANGLPLTAGAGLGKLGNVGFDTTKSWGADCNVVLDQLKPDIIGNAGAIGGWGTGNNCAMHTIRALERNGLVRTLAEPNLTAVSGEAAKFLAGGEYPVPTVDAQGKQSVTYKEFGVSVSFTPVVLSEGRISLKIESMVSELSDVGAVTLSSISIPAIKVRRANSVVELPSGGTLAMAGLISEDTRKNIDGIPGVKDLPILGTLFRSQDYIKRETELVVLVTPYMVRPTSKQKYAKPTDGLAAASDMKLNLLGHMNRVYGKNSPPSLETSVKDGKVGFIVD